MLTPAPPTCRPTDPSCFDIVTGTIASTFIDLMRTVTDRAALLRPVVRQPILGLRQRPSDSDVLGPEIPADGLTVRVSAGSSLFDDRSAWRPTNGRTTRADARLARHPQDRCEFLPELRDHVQKGPLRLMGVSLRG